MEFTGTPLTPNCARVFSARVHAVVGISLGNSYFRGEVLCGLLRWLGRRFQRLDIVIPDSSFRDNLLVTGRSAEYAEEKTAREAGTARRRALRSWQRAGLPSPAEPHLHLLSELAGSHVYRALRRRVDEALATDPTLHETCLDMSTAALRSHLGGAMPSPAQAEAGLQYLAAELPFFIGSADVFDVSSSVCFYHRPVPVAELLFARRGRLRPSLSQGYALIRPVRLPSTEGDTTRVHA
ncbi:tRNA-dependent cyclodipeptide synthase [Streptomyces sp. URMC 129]|uniref:tRNA-dependent cyclodipeptide synthase n=1 Tax=Streptomyces sp. URMC 129 TaxID=3423407 RepID=UPI003F1B1091